MSDRAPVSTPERRAPLRALSSVLAWFDRPEGRTLRLLLFGLVVAVAGTYELSRVHPAPWVILGTRAEELERTLAALDAGWPVLTGLVPGSDVPYRAAGTDDHGLYLFVPWLANTLGYDDPVNLLRWIALAAFGIAVALYPWMMREITGSTLAALGSPFVLLIALWLMPLADIYWLAAWVALALLPPLLILDRRWPRHGLAIVLGLLVLASVASSVRGLTGLPILIGAVMVVARRPWTRRGRVLAVGLCLVAFLSVSTFGLSAARAVRENQLAGQTVSGDVTRAHPVWHTAYIGLGYLPNRWDIRYQDLIGYRDVLRVDPKARYVGPAYHRILRDRYLRILRDEPVFAAETYGSKLLVAMRPAIPALLAVALFAPWLLLVDPRRARWRRDAIFLVVAALFGLTTPLLATPWSSYLLGWFGAVLLAAMIAVGAVLAEWRAALAYVRAPTAARRAVVGSSAVAVAVLAVVLVVAPGIEQRALDWNAKPPPRVTQPADAVN